MRKVLIRYRGFSLAEVVAGMFLLAFLLVTISGVFIGGLSGSKKAEKRVVAVNLAESMLDNIMLMPYDEVLAGTYPPDPAVTVASGDFPPSPYPETTAGGSSKYKYEVQVSDISGSGGNLKKVIVTVSIKGAPGEGNTSVTLSSLKKY